MNTSKVNVWNFASLRHSNITKKPSEYRKVLLANKGKGVLLRNEKLREKMPKYEKIKFRF